MMFFRPPIAPKYPDNNPKSVIGVTKVPLALIPPVGLIEQARAHENGANKYGPYNWRGENVTISEMVYLHAILRHVLDVIDGENVATDSGVSHLGHVSACCNIILDAEANGNLIDDRPVKGKSSARLYKYERRD